MMGLRQRRPFTLDDVELESSHSLERVGITEYPKVADGARVTSGISSSGATTRYQELSSGRTVANPELGLFLWRGDVEVSLGYGDFLRGVKELKALSLKEWRRRMKNEVFKVSNATTLSWDSCLCAV